MTCNRLFVYGTLLLEANDAGGAAARQRLYGEARFFSGASIMGRLHDLGEYPGVIPDGGGGVVAGEVLVLEDPAVTFEWLDHFEGEDEYERRLVRVELQAGGSSQAWLYVYRLDAGERPVIAGGSWLDWTRS